MKYLGICIQSRLLKAFKDLKRLEVLNIDFLNSHTVTLDPSEFYFQMKVFKVKWIQ